MVELHSPVVIKSSIGRDCALCTVCAEFARTERMREKRLVIEAGESADPRLSSSSGGAEDA
jgi:hypothetical protein